MLGPSGQWVRPLLPFLGIGAINYFMGVCGFIMGGGVIGEQGYLIWPPTGVALFALVGWGPRIWPAIAIPSLVLSLGDKTSPLASVLIAVGNTIGPLVALRALDRAAFDQRLYTLRDYLVFIFVGCTTLSTVTACIGVAALLTSGDISRPVAASSWLTWWVGDFMGALLIGPTLISLFPQPRRSATAAEATAPPPPPR